MLLSEQSTLKYKKLSYIKGSGVLKLGELQLGYFFTLVLTKKLIGACEAYVFNASTLGVIFYYCCRNIFLNASVLLISKLIFFRLLISIFIVLTVFII